jgi:hypothetical protein
MESTPRLYRTLVSVLSCHTNWLDVRHLKTLTWMVSGLILSREISLGAWALYVHSRAHYVASSIRRFRRFLDNDRIDVPRLYAPLLHQALQGWDRSTLYVALDTSMLWNSYCLVRLSLIYRGRAIPIVWAVLEHGSASIAYEAYHTLLDQAAQQLFPFHCKVVFLADRGFADTTLMRHLQRLGWHFRIRIKASFWIYRKGQRPRKTGTLRLRAGHPRFWHGVAITEERLGPVHLAMGRPLDSNERWMVISDEPTDLDTFREYGLRFDIEENFLDDKSNGFQLEASLIRSAPALERLCLVLAVATLYLVSQGTHLVETGQRRRVDAHWFRGNSYLKIGWNWIRYALSRKEKLLTHLVLSPKPDPEPAMASRKQHHQRTQPRFLLELRHAA